MVFKEKLLLGFFGHRIHGSPSCALSFLCQEPFVNLSFFYLEKDDTKNLNCIWNKVVDLGRKNTFTQLMELHSLDSLYLYF